MLEVMRHDAFYDQGSTLEPDLGIYAGWTALQGSFASHQRFRNEDGRILLIFAGECFVESDTVKSLRARGHRVEQEAGGWMVHLYEERGSGFFQELNGIFSGLLIDTRERVAYLFNDRYGVERLYVHEAEGEVYFASEAKAILAVVPGARAFDPQGLAEHLAFGCTIGERSLFQGITVLPGASLWTWQGHRVAGRRTYFSPNEWEDQERLPVREFESELRALLISIVPRYGQSDSKLGISLTAGLDTRMVMACLPPDPEKMICFTYSGEKVDPLDSRLAARIADAAGLRHRALRIEEHFFSGFGSWADRTVYLTDGYFGITGAHEIYMSSRARDLAPLRLTGNYGSEILRGSSTFKPDRKVLPLLQPDLAARVALTAHTALGTGVHPVTFAAFRETPLNLFGNLAAGRSQLGFRTPYLDNAFVRLAYRCPAKRKDSREACCTLIRKAAPRLAAIPSDRAYLGTASPAIAKARHYWAQFTFKLDYLNNQGFPNAFSPVEPIVQGTLQKFGLLGLHKHLHYRSWFKTKLAGFIKERLDDPSVRRSPYWDAKRGARLADEHIRGQRNNVHEINAVLTLQSIEQQLLQRPVSAVPDRL